jgi:hypothetical protein
MLILLHSKRWGRCLIGALTYGSTPWISGSYLNPHITEIWRQMLCLFIWLIIRLFHLIFSAETVFFSHNKSVNRVFSRLISPQSSDNSKNLNGSRSRETASHSILRIPEASMCPLPTGAATPLARLAWLSRTKTLRSQLGVALLCRKSLNNAIRSAAADRHPRSSVCSATAGG